MSKSPEFSEDTSKKSLNIFTNSFKVLTRLVEHHKGRLLLVAEGHKLHRKNWNSPTSPERPANMNRMREIREELQSGSRFFPKN